MATCARNHDRKSKSSNSSSSHLNHTEHATKKKSAAAAADGAEFEMLLNEAAGLADVDNSGSDLPMPAFTPGQEKVVKHMWQRANTLADNALAKVRYVYYIN